MTTTILETALTVARELLDIQQGSFADARALADDAPEGETRDAIHAALDNIEARQGLKRQATAQDYEDALGAPDLYR